MLFAVKPAVKNLASRLGYEILRKRPTLAEKAPEKAPEKSEDAVIEFAMKLVFGQIHLAESRFLGELVRDLKAPGPIVEIGTLYGWSTRVMAMNKSPGRELITVDNYSWNPLNLSPDGHFRLTRALLEPATTKCNVRIVRAEKDRFYANYKGPAPALVFLDAIHTYEETKADIDWSLRVGAGIICLHDYHCEAFPGVFRAVNEAGGADQLVDSLVVLPQRSARKKSA